MSNLDRKTRQTYELHRLTCQVSGRASYRPVASYDQMFAFLVKIRSILARPSLHSMNYIFANQEALHEVRGYVKRLCENSNLAAQACHEAQRNTEGIAGSFQRAWDLVDVKANAIEIQSRYVNSISQEMAATWRTHTSPPNKSWETLVFSLAFELKEALKIRRSMRLDLQKAEKDAEQWEPRYIRAVDEWCNTYEGAMRIREAYMAMHKEYLTGHSLAKIFMRDVRHWIKDESESERVWRIDQALIREEQSVSEMSLSKQQG